MTSHRRRATDEPQIRHRRGLAIVAAFSTAAAVAAIVALAVSALGAQSNRSDELAQLARENRARIADIAANAHRIQASRRDSILISCRQTNERHDRTIRTLDRLLAARVATANASERRRLRESRTSTVLLIEALAPKRDCRRLADRLITP